MRRTAAEYADFLRLKAPGCQVLAQVGAFELITSWTAAGGGYTNTWKATIVQRQTIHSFRRITSVTFADPGLATPEAIGLTTRTTLADVDANLGSFYFDETLSVLYVSLAASADPNDQYAYAGFTLYFSTGDPLESGRCFIDEDAGNVYYPYICAAPSTDKTLEDPFLSSIATGTATLGLDAATGKLDAIWREYIWEFGTVVVLFGGERLPLSQYATLFMGSTRQKSWSDELAQLHLVDSCDPLLIDVAGAPFVSPDISNAYTYTGNGSYGYGYAGTESNVASFMIAATGNINGTGAMTQVVELGQPKPIVYGSLKGFSPVVVSLKSDNASKQTAIVCVSDTAYKSISQVYVGGLTTGVAWWISPASGYVAVMLVPTVSGAPSSITQGITIDFEATELSAGVLMDNPADIVDHLLTTTRAETTANGSSGETVTSDDSTTLITFTGNYGSNPPNIFSAYSGGQQSSPSYDAIAGRAFERNMTPVGHARPLSYGTTLNAPLNYWARSLANTYSQTFGGYYYTSLIVDVGRFTSITAVRAFVSGAWTSSNVGWQVNAAEGLVYVVIFSGTPGVPIVAGSVQVDLVAPAATGSLAPAGPPLNMDPDALAASRTLCTGYSLAFSVTTATALRDILMGICRDTLSYVYVSNEGLVRFHTYSPSTDGEFALTEETGDFTVSPEVVEPAERCYRSVIVEYSLDPNRANRNGGNYLSTSHTVANSIGLLTGRTVDFTVNASFHATQASAALLAERLAKLLSRGAPVYTVDTHIGAMSLDLGDKVSVSRERLPVAAPGDVAHCYVTRITRDLENATVSLELTENLISDLAGGW